MSLPRQLPSIARKNGGSNRSPRDEEIIQTPSGARHRAHKHPDAQEQQCDREGDGGRDDDVRAVIRRRDGRQWGMLPRRDDDVRDRHRLLVLRSKANPLVNDRRVRTCRFVIDRLPVHAADEANKAAGFNL